MATKRRRHSPEGKAKAAPEVQGIEPIHATAAKHQVDPVQVSRWKKDLLKRLSQVFATKAPPTEAEAVVK